MENRKVRALVVDDSFVMRKIILKQLSELTNISVIGMEATNGKDALEKFKKEPCELILCDWNMPEMDGLTFVKEARSVSHYPQISFRPIIIMLTAEGGDNRLGEAFTAGADAYINKPFSPAILEEKITQLIYNN